MEEYIWIQEPNILNDRTLAFRLCLSEGIRKYFTSYDLTFQYDVVIGNADTGILQIPAVASVITVALAVGANVYIKNLDRTYLKSLSKVASTLRNWYPEFSSSTKIIVENIVSNKFYNDGYGLLFSGGVDSTASYIRRKNKKPNLVTVFGAGIDIQSGDENLTKKLTDFSRQEQVNLNFVKTNVDRVINRDILYEEFGLNWWLNVYYGLFLTGICAPLTPVKNMRTLLIASSGCTQKFRYPFGSHPSIDSNISWADVNVVHDGYEISRQDKIKYFIKSYVKETGCYPFLRVCTKSSQENCGNCEKCFRTITGLVLEDIDPRKCGFNNFNSRTFDFIKESFINGSLLKRRNLVERKGQLYIRMADVFLWQDIQKHVPETIADSNIHGEFFKWFRDFNVLEHSQRISPMRLPRLLLGSVVQILAPLNSYFPNNLRKINRAVFRLLLGK